MPLPLEMPPMWAVFPPTWNSYEISFLTVSVVMMARATASEPASDASSFETSSGSAASMASTFRRTPMTPVLETSTSDASTSSASETSAISLRQVSSPSGAQALAMELLAMTT